MAGFNSVCGADPPQAPLVEFSEPSTMKSSSSSRARGWRGRRESRLPGDPPPISLSDSLHRSWHRATIPRGVFVKSRQKQQQPQGLNSGRLPLLLREG